MILAKHFILFGCGVSEAVIHTHLLSSIHSHKLAEMKLTCIIPDRYDFTSSIAGEVCGQEGGPTSTLKKMCLLLRTVVKMHNEFWDL